MTFEEVLKRDESAKREMLVAMADWRLASKHAIRCYIDARLALWDETIRQRNPVRPEFASG